LRSSTTSLWHIDAVGGRPHQQDAKNPEPSSEHDATARQIVESAFAVHRTLGPRLLESVYEQCLERELRSRRKHLGLLINFNTLRIKDGIRRLVRS